MAALTTAEKAPLLVETSTGVPVNPGNRTYTIPEGAPFHIQNVGGGEGSDYVVADFPGSETVLVSFDGQSGSLEVTVSAAPLTVTLGPVEPK
jgi:hypothetical protein